MAFAVVVVPRDGTRAGREQESRMDWVELVTAVVSLLAAVISVVAAWVRRGRRPAADE